MNGKQSGFTLIELVIVIILLGILAASITPRFQDIQDNARQAVVDSGVAAVKSAALISFAENQGVPVTGASVQAEVDFDNPPRVQFQTDPLVCNAGGAGDTVFVIEHVDDTTVTSSGTIPNEFCQN